MFLTETNQDNALANIFSCRAMQCLYICTISMLLAQIMKFIIYSIRDKKPNWHMLSSTGGFPSSHTAFTASLCITLAMFQIHDYGELDWSFAVAFAFCMITITDARGVRFEASKHAKILNNLVASYSEEERRMLGYGDNGHLKELLGHKGKEVLGGFLVAGIVSIIGFMICI